MRSTRRAATTALGVLGILCTPGLARAQGVLDQPVSRIAAINPGAIQGVVLDENGKPLAGAMVSALGASTKFAVSDRTGHFEMRTLAPGPYLVQAHRSGFIASRAQIVEVRPAGHTSSSIALRRIASSADAAMPVLTAGIGGGGDTVAPTPEAAPSGATNDDHGETAWRIRHARRSVLKETLTPDMLAAADAPSPDASIFGPITTFGHAVSSPARAASALFGSTPFSGQVNLLTTGSFDSAQQLFTTDSFGRGVAYFAVGAPVGSTADWSMKAALTQGDISSWIVAGSYVSHGDGPHQYEVGMSYATQRYDGANPALRAASDGNRDAGALYGSEMWTIAPTLAITYGARYSRYDYLPGHGLLSPRATITVTPASRTRINASVSSRADAPGADEFLPPTDDGVWLPPQRTFSPLVLDRTLTAERTNYTGLGLERDLGSATVGVGAFRQQVSNQLVTVFGADVPGSPDTTLGHYYVSNSGDVDLIGWTASFRGAFTKRVHGSVTYSQSRAQWTPTSDVAYTILFAPSGLRLETEQIRDVTASVETAVPETATRVVVLYRVSNGFATRDLQTPGVDTRFDVQVRQALPFMNFSNAQWEMLVAVRNFFREAGFDQSLYDELLVVHPPKRIVGGLTLRF